MRISAGGNLIVETAMRGVRVMRFTRPDLRKYLDDISDAATTSLFQEINDTVLCDLPKGWTLIVNLGLVDCINAAFYRCLLYLRKSVHERRARLLLCGLTPFHQEIFELFRGPELFTIVGSEGEAYREALRPRNLLRPHFSRETSQPDNDVCPTERLTVRPEC